MNDRLKLLRLELDLNQREFSSKVDLSQPAFAMIEKGSRALRDIHISRICSEFNVNENWLRTGEGEMFIENDSTIIAELASEYRLDAIDQKIIEHYVKLDEGDRQKIKQYVLSLAEQIAGLEETAATIEVDPIEAELESYRRELEAEKKGRILSVSHVESEPS